MNDDGRFEFRATVEEVTTIGMRVRSLADPADGEAPLLPADANGLHFFGFPGACTGEDLGIPFARAFGTIFGIGGAVRIIIEPVHRVDGSSIDVMAQEAHDESRRRPGKGKPKGKQWASLTEDERVVWRAIVRRVLESNARR